MDDDFTSHEDKAQCIVLIFVAESLIHLAVATFNSKSITQCGFYLSTAESSEGSNGDT
jgi:hypothetical protein